MYIPYEKPTIVMWMPSLRETKALDPKFPPYDFEICRVRDFTIWLHGNIIGATTTFEAAMAVVRLFEGETFDYIRSHYSDHMLYTNK